MNHFFLSLNFKTAYYLAFKSEFIIYLFWLLLVQKERLKIFLKFSRLTKSIRAGYDAGKLYRFSLPLNFKEFIQYSAGWKVDPKISIVDDKPGLKDFFQKWETVKNTPGRDEFINEIVSEIESRAKNKLKKNNKKRAKMIRNIEPTKNGNKRIKTRRKNN